MSAQKMETFDISAKQREILQFKHAKKIQLRQQYLKEVLNPTVQTMPVCIDDFLLVYELYLCMISMIICVMQRDTVHLKSCLIAPSILCNH